MTGSALDHFSQVTRQWFTGAFAAPTTAQEGAWQAIARGENTLVVAPTGSGKTLAAFLWSLDRLAAERVTAPPSGEPSGKGRERHCRVVYVSPLKALAVDIERNLRAPLAGLKQTARRMGLPVPEISVAVRSGDTSAEDRRRFAAHPADILITTPESLYLILTSQAREALRGVETVIVDEVHAVAATKRGAHLALTLERLDSLLAAPAQRVGLSATVRPVSEVATFLGGARPTTVVQPPSEKVIDIDVVVPVEDMTELDPAPRGPSGGDGSEGLWEPEPAPRRSIWPHVEEHLLGLIGSHRSTIVFANSRRLAERLCARLNELAYERAEAAGPEGPPPPAGSVPPALSPPALMMAQAGSSGGASAEIVRAHHGSVSKEERAQIEEALKSGRLPAVVATSSLELGIDMGAVDLVACVEAPPSVASGLQRIGRAGHQVGAVSKGVIFPKYRGDLVQTAVVAERMKAGQIEEMRYPRNPLDVLAQQIVAMCALDEWTVDDLETTIRRAAPYATLPRSALEATLDMLAGRYPSEEFAELRPRVVWDRVTGRVTGRPGAQRLAVTNAGTIPDRGMFGVFLAGADTGRGGRRVGELDEEMVYESRVGDVFVLGATSWRIEDITTDRVLVTPAPGQPGKLPFWHGDTPGRPAELGRALGAFLRELSRGETGRLAEAGLDAFAAGNLLAYLAEQREATGYVPDDRTIVVERFHDELGDWRVVVHTPYGARVHAPWALAIGRRLRERYGMDIQAMHSDDGIVLRIPDTLDGAPSDVAVFDADELEQIVVEELGGSALFASRFRECAGRALLLPRRSPGRRSPLWQQRQRAASLLAVASKYGSFPIVLETMRECLQDVFDVPGLLQIMRDIAARRVRVVEVETGQASPFASSLLLTYIGAFMYEGDAPLAERRAQALALDTRLLAELLGEADLRELLDPDVVADTERELARLDRPLRDAEDLADLLRTHGPLQAEDVTIREGDPSWLSDLEGARRAIRVRVAGVEQWAAVEDSARLRDALGVPLPVGVPHAFLEPVPDPLADLLARHARTRGPFLAATAAARFGLGVAVVADGLRRLAASGRVVAGEFRPGGWGEEWCDAGVLRLLRRRSLARLRKEVEPVPPEALGVFGPAWHGVTDGRAARGMDALVHAIEQLQGAAVPASALETLVLPSRVPGYEPALLDELTASGEVIWSGQGSLPGGDGWVALFFADTAPLLLPPPAEITLTPLHEKVLEALGGGGALFFRDLSSRVGSMDDTALAGALWDLVWSGRVSGDTLAPLRAALGSGRPAHRATSTRRRRAVLPTRSGPPTVSGRWWLLPEPSADPTQRAHAQAEVLLERHGVVTKGAVAAERLTEGFASVYPVLRAFEETGRCRRGYFVEGLGGAQFALPGAVDRLRALAATLTASPHRAHSDPHSPASEPWGGASGSAEPWKSSPSSPAAGRPATWASGGPPFPDPGAALAGYAEFNQTSPASPHTRPADPNARHSSEPPEAPAEHSGTRPGEHPDIRPSSAPANTQDPGEHFGSPPGASPEARPSDAHSDTQGPGRGFGAPPGEQPEAWRSGGGPERHAGGRRAVERRAVVLAATDPANPYGAALAWPEHPGEVTHKPGRKAGALVVLVDGRLVLYVERGGKTLLSFADDERLRPAVDALALAVRDGALGKLTVEKADGTAINDSPLATALEAAGFHPTPRGLRLRA
ncbi:DEAD/DEAH box helicase [Sphaerisporangium krabiense]|uniref:ATP-dependent Lhr-like helicase n=1 Tax=Sphaerisporangium krabiense TaxID=763782 RepID=A0A7W9DRZ9_9ACTN|nr:ATP-dependent helicase [Sphaerisporangium krabiense]MBB5628674.1 ATP-dependent Lhr-like helicase [Sphaerisporangium krabiense]GII60485.1 DEAD/DEAH box helicase [Sphaerisporangium krabiense]